MGSIKWIYGYCPKCGREVRLRKNQFFKCPCGAQLTGLELNGKRKITMLGGSEQDGYQKPGRDGWWKKNS